MQYLAPLPNKKEFTRRKVPLHHKDNWREYLSYTEDYIGEAQSYFDWVLCSEIGVDTLRVNVPRHVDLFSKVHVQLRSHETLKRARLCTNNTLLKEVTFDFERIESFYFFQTKAINLLGTDDMYMEFDIESEHNNALHRINVILRGFFVTGEKRQQLAREQVE